MPSKTTMLRLARRIYNMPTPPADTLRPLDSTGAAVRLAPTMGVPAAQGAPGVSPASPPVVGAGAGEMGAVGSDRFPRGAY